MLAAPLISMTCRPGTTPGLRPRARVATVAPHATAMRQAGAQSGGGAAVAVDGDLDGARSANGLEESLQRSVRDEVWNAAKFSAGKAGKPSAAAATIASEKIRDRSKGE